MTIDRRLMHRNPRTAEVLALSKITPYAKGMKKEILEMMQDRCPNVEYDDDGLTPDEFQLDSGKNYLIMSVRPRFTDLRNDGFIRPTDRLRKNQNGNDSTVWVLGRDPLLDTGERNTIASLRERVAELEAENKSLDKLIQRLRKALGEDV